MHKPHFHIPHSADQSWLANSSSENHPPCNLWTTPHRHETGTDFWNQQIKTHNVCGLTPKNAPPNRLSPDGKLLTTKRCR